MSAQELSDKLRRIARLCSERVGLDEREVVTLFVEQGVFATLGYGKVGEDLRIEKRIRRGRVDVLLRGITGRPICVIEFKRPRTDLSAHRGQLEEYVAEALPDVAVLTEGLELRLYRRLGTGLDWEGEQTFALAELTPDQAHALYEALRKRVIDWHRLDSVEAALRECAEQPIRVTSPDREGGRVFLRQFELSPRVAFGHLARALYEALPSLLKRSRFARGAYAFWEKIYARSLSEEEVKQLTRRWKDFVGEGTGKQVVYRFMFALETAYAMISRLMLAKAMQDAGFGVQAVEAFRGKLDALDRRGTLRLQDYVEAVAAVFEEGKRQAFRSLFDSDIFDWWLDLPELEEVACEACEALAEATLAVFQFDFSGLSGDLLGQLYQSYFDPETRRALGEFYTPPEVVEFILDQVGYQGSRVLTQRLLDPACGSGTFLVHALKRYLKASEGCDPRDVLRGLAEGFRIVGFDINPFAVLMAQVNYALHLLPIYARALERDHEFEILTLPVFRTDSLRQEKREGEREQLEERGGMQSFTLEYRGEVAWIRTKLPVEVEDGQFLEVKIPVPRYDRARDCGWVTNVEEYFRVQHAMFAAVRESRRRGRSAPTVQRLQGTLARLGLAHAEELARYVHPSIEKVLEVLNKLETKYGDGRFLKTLEDLALAMTLKHELQYNYVVGNPPYVRIQNIPEQLREYWQGLYSWAEGNFDIFIPFIERAIAYWLKEGGKLGFICSNRFLSANYAAPLRRGLPKLAEAELILDLRDTRIFKDALNYPAIFIAKRTDAPHREELAAARVFADPEEGPSALFHEVAALLRGVDHGEEHAEGKHVDAFKERRVHLGPQGWWLMPPEERRIFRKLEKAATHRLHELTLTQSGGFAGYQTSADDIMVLKLVEDRGDAFLLWPKGGGKPVEIEKKLVRPWLFGRDVERWHIAWDGWHVFFPYLKIDGTYKLIPCGENESVEPFTHYADKAPRMEDFPKAWEYLKSHKRELCNREGGRFKHDWYGAARPQNLELYEEPKIVIQINSRMPDMAYDGELGFVFQAGGRGGGVYGIALDTKKTDPWLTLALLNSSVIDFFFKHIAPVYTGRTYSYSDAFIKQLPIRLPKSKSQRETAKKLVKLAQELTRLKSRLRAKERKRAAFPEPQLEMLKGRFELYPLHRLVKDRPQAQKIRVEQVRLQRQLDRTWVMAFGRTRLIFPSEPHARAAEAWLRVQGKRQVPSNEFMGLKLPTEEWACYKLLDLLAEAEWEIESLRTRLEEMEEELDDYVAGLYGLSNEDRKVIRLFLKRF